MKKLDKKQIVLIALSGVLVATSITSVAFMKNDKMQVESATTTTETATESTTVENSIEETTKTDTTTEATTAKSTSNTTKKNTQNTNKTQTSNNQSGFDENGEHYFVVNLSEGEEWTGEPTEPDFEYVDKVTTNDGVTYYKILDDDGTYYYTDVYGIGRYTEFCVYSEIRPTDEEIYANPISTCKMNNGITWYKYQTKAGNYCYLSSDGTHRPWIPLDGIVTEGREVVTVHGVKFYKTYEDGCYTYYDKNGNELEYCISFCHQCGKTTCNRSRYDYYCDICQRTVKAYECHPKTCYEAEYGKMPPVDKGAFE